MSRELWDEEIIEAEGRIDNQQFSSESDSGLESSASGSDSDSDEEMKPAKKRQRVMTTEKIDIRDNHGKIIVEGSSVSSISRTRVPKHVPVPSNERKRKKKESVREKTKKRSLKNPGRLKLSPSSLVTEFQDQCLSSSEKGIFLVFILARSIGLNTW